MKYDFCGYATKNDLRCSDGRVIVKDAFKHNDGDDVPLVWQHIHTDPSNVLGHAHLENRDDGVYAYCYLNDTESGSNCKKLIEHGDITSLSIYANQLKQEGYNVVHGDIKEVSLVLAGANPGAYIENVTFSHSDGLYDTDDEEAVIYTGEFISHAEEDEKEPSVKEVLSTYNEEQKKVLYYLVGLASEKRDASHSDLEEETLKYNVFDKETDNSDKKVLSHSDIEEIFRDAEKYGSLKESFLEHAQDYGIENIDYLFPDAKSVTPTPDFIQRGMEWVPKVLNGVKHIPFSRIKSVAADITAKEARARGYVKGSFKKEEVFPLLKRVTTPTTIYKKQKLDRDDIIDITDLDVVAWLKAEMRMMLDEEIARCILVGDGREITEDDKINEENIRPIYNDNDMYAHHVVVSNDTSAEELIEAILRAKIDYKGSGSPNFYTTDKVLVDMLLVKDQIGRRLYNSQSELASALGVREIVTVPVMENVTHEGNDLIGIVVNLSDYTVGADRGGQVSMFDDFDIDYNQYKYLIETRCSGCLTHPKSALVIESGSSRNSYM